MRATLAQDLSVIRDVVVSPMLGFERLARRPAWGTLFLLVVLVNAALTAAIYRQVGHAAVDRAAAADAAIAADPSAQQTVRRFAELGQLVGLALTPLAYLAKWAVIGMLFWSLLVLAGFDARFRPLMAMVAHANIATLSAGLLAILVVLLRGDTATSLADLNPRLGLDAFVILDSPVKNALLALVSPFEVWYVALLSIGVSATAGLRRRTGILLAGALWVSAAALYVATVVFSAQLGRA